MITEIVEELVLGERMIVMLGRESADASKFFQVFV
jgi:hypothetical protein